MPKIIKQPQIIIFLAGILAFFLFSLTFSSYFFQDDWFSFLISYPKDFLSFFIPRSDVIYYRPLGMQIPFSIMKTFFGLNPLPFRLLTFFIHMVNGILVYQIFRKFFKNNFLNAVGAGLYLTSASHITIFYWSATFAFMLGPTFFLATVITFLEGNKKKSLLFFVFGLLTNELLLVIPLILFFIQIFKISEKLFISLKKLIPYAIVSMIYILLRLLFKPVLGSGHYSITFDPVSLIKNIKFYFLWALNWHEQIQDQFTNFFSLNQLFIHDFKYYVSVLTLFSTLIAIVLIAGLLFFLLVTKQKKDINDIIFFCGWFFISLIPVLFLSKHAFTYYVPLPLIGVIMLLIKVLGSVKNNKILFCLSVVLLTFWSYTSYLTIDLNTDVHWAPRRAVLSKKIIDKIQTQQKNIDGKATILVPLKGSDEIKWALGEQNGMKVVYDNDEIDTYYFDKSTSVIDITGPVVDVLKDL